MNAAPLSAFAATSVGVLNIPMPTTMPTSIMMPSNTESPAVFAGTLAAFFAIFLSP
jgi:hypothetical protein